MRTFSWTCDAYPDWEWVSANEEGQPTIPVANDGVRSGQITLPPNSNYWYVCIGLVLQGQAFGRALLQYRQDGDGAESIQALTLADNSSGPIWNHYGRPAGPGIGVSQTGLDGGFGLTVRFL